ncbi:hypothetical protein HZ326_21817 [Fusarium oxysporum f. sp. albedinis]|nr:hypothetical protein HZ326_21817 [Fusarium oxysporum f. sp. albedinis]
MIIPQFSVTALVRCRGLGGATAHFGGAACCYVHISWWCVPAGPEPGTLTPFDLAFKSGKPEKAGCPINAAASIRCCDEP